MPSMETWEAVAREAIRDLVARYNANGDSGRFEQVLALFAGDAAMELDDGIFSGHEEILSIFTGAQQRWTDELNPPGTASASHHVRHSVSTHQIDFDDESHARGYCYYSVIMPHGLDHWGRYFDNYVRDGGRWLFARRRVTVDGRTDMGD